jgi:GDP-L-fucose synthase
MVVHPIVRIREDPNGISNNFPGDKHHPINRKVLPVLIRRFHKAAEAHASSVTSWCTDTPLREFIDVGDLGDASMFVLEQWQPMPDGLQFLNVGTGLDLTIRDLRRA